MKKPLLLCLMIAISLLCFAGIDEFYSFNATTGTYVPITGTQITSIHSDDALSDAINIGFTFPYGENVYSVVRVSSNGWVGLGPTFSHSNLSNQLLSTEFQPVVAPLWDDTSLSGGTAQYLMTGTAPNRVFTIQYANLRWNYSATNQFNLQVRLYETGKIDFIYGSYTGTPSNASASIGINMAPGGANWMYSVTPGPPASVSQTAENTSISAFPANGTIYEFLPAVPVANDMAAVGLTGNTTPSQGTPTNYTVTVRNRGSNPQTTYQVKLVTSTGAELASIPGTAIAAGQTIDFTVPWTPTTEGPLIIRGKVVLAGDQNPNNDQTQPLSITVMPPGVIVVTIGSGNELARLPVDMFFRNSLYETLIYPTEIGMVGNILALSLYNSFQTNLPNMPTKIWLGSTQSENLSAGWIPSTQLTLVFDGNVNYPSGQNTILIPLQTVYTYTGGNLVLMMNRPMDTTYYSSMDQFYAQTVGTNRALNIYSDGTAFDPANPPAGAQIMGQFPKISITMTPLGTDPMFIVNPASANYGQVLMNTTHSRQFTIMNGGGGNLGINSISISGSQHFSLQNVPTLPASLVTGQNISFTAVFNPTAAGVFNATITVVDNVTRTTHTIPLSGTCVDPTIYTLPYMQNFDLAVVPALPVDWSSIQQTTNPSAYIRTITNPNFSPPNAVHFSNAGDATANLILIAPPYVNTIQTNTTRVNFRARGASTGYSLIVGVMTNPQDASTFQPIQTLSPPIAWTEYVVSFGAYAGTGRHIAFKLDSAMTWSNVYLDNVMLEVIPQNDLAATAVLGNSTPSVGNATNYTVNVYNWGSNAQTNYTVKLFNANDVELATAPGIAVNPGQTAAVSLSWTPTTQGPTSIYGKVFLTGDQNPLNDASPAYPITVMPAGMVVVTVGIGDELGSMPVNMYWMNSLFETLYYPQELGMFGTVTALSFYNNFSTNLPNKPTKIWLGSTQSDNLAGGWIPSTQLTLVYDGNVNYPSGQNTITIPLQTPYTYAGGNLVMMVNRPMDTTYFNYNDQFYCQTIGTNRSLLVYSDGTQFFPDNPPTGVSPTGQFPKTTFHLTPMGPDPIFMVNPSSHNYGTVLLNSTHNRNFSVMNVGGGTLTINSIGIAGSEYMTLQNMPTLPANLNTGQSLNFTARYNPTVAGTHAATITVNDNLRSAGRSNRDREPHTIALTATCVDPTINTLPYLQNFDAVTAPVLPVQWTTIVQSTATAAGVTTSTTNPYTAPNSALMTNSNDANASVLFVAPPYVNTINTNATRTKFYARSAGANFTLSVGVLTDPQNAATYTETQMITLSTTWTEYVVTFGGYAGTGRTIAFKHGLGGTNRSIFLDNIMLEYIPQNDLAALSVTGNTTPSVGMLSNYTVSVFNWGSNPQTDYLVKLFRTGDVEIGSVPGPNINPGQTVNVPVPWTPTTEGATQVYGKVFLTGDQNNLNDQTPNFPVVVQPQGLMVLTVGTGDQTGRFPLDMFYMNSLFESLYYPAELGNTLGIIFGVGFYNNFQTNLQNMPTKIWMGTTTQADLSAGWIPSTQLTLVFDGNVNYPSGQNLIHIPFTTPYMYLVPDNLVMLVQRPMDQQYYSSQDLFQTQTVGTNRARNAYADGTAFDPANPPTATAQGGFPKTSFYIIPGGVGHINGTVTGAGGVPLDGVQVQFATGGYSTTTNAQGQYQIQNLIADTYQITFSRYGYIDQIQTVVIPEDETVTLNISLVQMPQVTVGGTILASDTGLGLPGAGIFLQGYANYTGNTNAQGVFSIPAVYANQAYSYTVICPGYQNASGNINVGGANYSFGNITLNEIAYAPRQVHGEIINNNSHVALEWQAPDPTALDLTESFEDETFPPENWSRVITNTGPPNTSGVYPSWCRAGAVTIGGSPVNPTDGNYQAGLWWSYDHQDEWLMTPTFNCPPAAYLRFESYVFLGSTNGDHYYVKVSLDEGNNWTTLWDASAQTGGWNYYDTPINIDLSLYEGQQIRLAWHATDPPSNDGLWYVWFIDEVYVGNEVNALRFASSDFSRRSASAPDRITAIDASLPLRLSRSEFITAPRVNSGFSASNVQPGGKHSTRSLIGYKVWRLQAGTEQNEQTWTLLTPTTHPNLTLTDTNWLTLVNGTYRWAVRAVYTSDVMSVPAFSNALVKQVVSGYISGVVRTPQTAPIQGATITAGAFTATTNTAGAYSMPVPIGTYDVTASKTGYISLTVEDVTVLTNQTTTVNFILHPGSDNDDDVIPVYPTELCGNFPNPFNPETTILFTLREAAAVKIEIYNLKGQHVKTLVDDNRAPGSHRVIWNGRDDRGNAVSSGIYFYTMSTPQYQSRRKMILMQ
ncbi:MAG: carboxypeptidase regulatory-like domain-containing protein [Candidatus Cloacimonadaceae bacterium]|nr:carboxypeptidase regulatory-like domain-containing protein [Candidatus Cloacimonadaceae bacterium]